MNFSQGKRDIEYVIRENKIIKEENEILREQVLGGILKDSKTCKTMEDTVGQVLDLQRKRIRNLEQEYDSLYDKYEEILRSKFKTAEESLDEILNKGCDKLRTKADSENFIDMVQQYAKEISAMKAKMTEQGAKILLNKDDNIYSNSFDLPSMHKSGAIKKGGVVHRLNPLKGVKDGYPSTSYGSTEDEKLTFTPTKSRTSSSKNYGDKTVTISSYTDHKAYLNGPSYKYAAPKATLGYGPSVLSREYNSDYAKR